MLKKPKYLTQKSAPKQSKPTTKTSSQATTITQDPSDETQMEASNHPPTSTTIYEQLPANLIIDFNKEKVVSILALQN